VYPALPPVDREPLSRVAASIAPDADRRTWRIALRPYLLQHDNTPLNAGIAVEAVKALQPSWNVMQTGPWTLVVTPDKPVNSLLDAADPQFSCGPFERVEGSKPHLRAFDLYWERRPFIDAMEVAASAQEADVAELALAGARRLRSDTHRLWTTSAMETVSVHAAGAGLGLREALSLALDRQSIVKVLFGGRGEAAGGLAPQAESGYAFLFPVQQDLIKARSLLATQKAAAGPIVLGYPANDTLLRQLADRIAVNARDAGLVLQVKGGNSSQWNMQRQSNEPFASFEAERAAMEERRLVPVVHVPRLYAIHSRVRGWEQAHDGRSLEIHPESIWLDS
jgi:MarR-like DNA-binding transcriptional regulator SgrR of sgrS sRNA